MRDKAYRLTAFTAIISAAGFLFRWLQNMQIFDAETGLAEPGRFISYLVVGIIVLAAAAFGYVAIRMRAYDAPTAPAEALGGQTILYSAVSVAVMLLLAVSGVLQLLAANAANYTSEQADQLVLDRICGVATVVAAVAVPFVTLGLKEESRAGMQRLCAALHILFAGLWLSAVYKTAASDPVLWHSAIEILAISAALMALYHTAGYFYGQPSPAASWFFCSLGAFLCILSAIDEHSGGENLCYAAVALLLLLRAYVITANLRYKDEPLAGEPAAAE